MRYFGGRGPTGWGPRAEGRGTEGWGPRDRELRAGGPRVEGRGPRVEEHKHPFTSCSSLDMRNISHFLVYIFKTIKITANNLILFQHFLHLKLQEFFQVNIDHQKQKRQKKISFLLKIFDFPDTLISRLRTYTWVYRCVTRGAMGEVSPALFQKLGKSALISRKNALIVIIYGYNLSIKMKFLRVSWGKISRFYPCRAFLSRVVGECLSKCPNSKKTPLP